MVLIRGTPIPQTSNPQSLLSILKDYSPASCCIMYLSFYSMTLFFEMALRYFPDGFMARALVK